jgi:glucokinase
MLGHRRTKEQMTDGSKPRGGIDLGGTKIQAVVVDGRNMLLGQARRATPTAGGPPDVVAELAATLQEAAGQAGCATADLAGVGVGAPGAASFETGVLAHAPNLPGWDDPYPLAAELSMSIGAPVLLGNDVGVAVDAEFQLGAGKPFNSILGIWWGTGVGGGIILDGRRWLGRGAAGEFGHTIVKVGGRAEPKGLRGTVEAFAGRAAMEARARKLVRRGEKTKLFAIMERKGRTRLSSGVWAKALEQKDAVAVKLIDEAVEAIGAGAASAVNLLDLEAVVIGGGLGTRLGQPHADLIAAAMQPGLFQPEKAPPVLSAQLGDLGGAIGAALLAAPAESAWRVEPALSSAG